MHVVSISTKLFFVFLPITQERGEDPDADTDNRAGTVW